MSDDLCNYLGDCSRYFISAVVKGATMSKIVIEPMSVEEIKKEFAWHHGKDAPGDWCNTCRLYLAWIIAEARARLCEYLRTRNIKLVEGVNPPEPSLLLEDWIAAVKKEVGWPGD